jgi:16S rRNA processing protein RimM
MSKNIIVVGRLGRSFGVKGWQVIQSFTDPPENILNYSPWYLQRAGGAAWDVLNETEMLPHKAGHIVRLQNVHNPEDSHTLSGSLIGVPKEALVLSKQEEATGLEYLWHDLVGCEVFDLEDRLLGEVDRLIETGAHDVLIVKGTAKEMLIPFDNAYLQSVDVTINRIVVDWRLDWS